MTWDCPDATFKLFRGSDQLIHFMGTYKGGVDSDFRMMPGQFAQHIENLCQRVPHPRTNIKRPPWGPCLSESRINGSDITHITEFTGHIRIAEFNEGKTFTEVLYQLGNKESFGLPASGIIERANNGERKLITPDTGHVLCGELTDGVVIARIRRR